MEINFFFRSSILYWNEFENRRQMPWLAEKDPYKIWLSEIILQQTRVSQGAEYYKKFVSKFPTIHLLAQANEVSIYKLWEGLGYYRRCKNLIHTAKYISKDLNGNFPNTFSELLNLKGIGQYTASAIASFAYNLPFAVVDANVYRVLSRFFGISTPTYSSKGKELFNELALKLLDKVSPGIYNQSIMDFGALICKPKNPLCIDCVLKSKCIAFKSNMVSLFPIKTKSLIKKKRWFYYLIVMKNDRCYVRKRLIGDIWENLYEFFLIEQNRPLSLKMIKNSDPFKTLFEKKNYKLLSISKMYSQTLTHQIITGQFIEIHCPDPKISNDYIQIEKVDIKSLPFPKIITTYLTDKNVSLNLLKELK